MDRIEVAYTSDPARGAVWHAVFAAGAPDLALVDWSPDVAAEIRYLVAWTPPDDLARAMPNLRVLFNIGAGIDYAVLDGTTMGYVLLQDTGLALKTVPIRPNTQYPALSGKGRAVMGMNLENTDLFDAVNAGVTWLWASKTNLGPGAHQPKDFSPYFA